MRGVEGPTTIHKRKNKKMAWQKDENEGVRHRRQDAHEQLKWEKLQAGRKDHHKSSTLYHMVTSHSNGEGNILK